MQVVEAPLEGTTFRDLYESLIFGNTVHIHVVRTPSDQSNVSTRAYQNLATRGAALNARHG